MDLNNCTYPFAVYLRPKEQIWIDSNTSLYRDCLLLEMPDFRRDVSTVETSKQVGCSIKSGITRDDSTPGDSRNSSGSQQGIVLFLVVDMTSGISTSTGQYTSEIGT